MFERRAEARARHSVQESDLRSMPLLPIRRKSDGKENGEPVVVSKRSPAELQAPPADSIKPPQRKPLANTASGADVVKAPSSSSIQVAQHAESEHVCLQEWSFAFNGSRPLQLTGRVYNNPLRTEVGFEEGDLLEYTSQVVSCNGRTVMTKSGTVYTLGKPAAGFDQLRKQLWICSRTGQLGRDDGSSVPPLDEDYPLLGIKLGEVVAAAPVKLPKVPGWSHQEGIAVSGVQ